MDQKELKKRLALHEKWLNSEEGGMRLDLVGADLRFNDLRFTNLMGADLRCTDLRGTSLMGADLIGAMLNHAITSGAIGVTAICAQVNTSAGNRLIAYYPAIDVVTAGCWQSSMAEFKKRVENVYKDRTFLYARYQRVIAFLEQEAAADKEKDDCATSRQGAEN